MYEAHFGLKRRPFRAVPDTESYYPAASHEVAIARLHEAIAGDEGIALLCGGPGSGKTIVCHRLLEQLGEDTGCVFLANSHVAGRTGLLQAILYDLGLPYEQKTEQELRLALTDHLLARYGQGKRTLLVCDEAQHLSADLLEELRLLGNLETRQGKAVLVLLASLPEIGQILKRPELAVLNQRLAARAALEPLAVQEAADYLVHHLRLAGGRPERIITDEALEILAQAARGVPRLLNQTAHQALALACTAGAEQVDAEAALEAIALLGLELEPPADASVPPADDIEPEETPADQASPRLFNLPKRPA